MISLKEKISNGEILYLDGGMGSQMAGKGLKMTSHENNITHPEVIEEIQREYIAAGSDCILTNTFTLNELYASKSGEKLDLAALNKAGVEIAKKAAQGKVYVLGDMGPTGDMLVPVGKGDEGQFFKNYYEQAKILADNGVDGFMIETVFDLREALIMLKAANEVAPDLPKIVSLTYASLRKGGCTIMGNDAKRNAEAVLEAGGTVIGANCGDLTPKQLVEIVKTMLPVGLPISVKPNAGMPVTTENGVIYNMGPEQFALEMKECFEAGARILGGCCGTTPEFINELVKSVGK